MFPKLLLLYSAGEQARLVFFFFFPDSASDCSAVKLLLTSEKYSNGNMNLFQIAVQVLCRMNSSREPEFYLFRKNKLNYMALKG